MPVGSTLRCSIKEEYKSAWQSQETPKRTPSQSGWTSTIKNEFLKGKVFRNIDEANRAIGKAIETYNTIRPHMSIDYMTPQDARECTGPLKKRWRSYREDAIQKARKDKESKELVTN